MQELRLVSVHEDGEHLLLGGDQDARFSLPIDDALRSATSRTPGEAPAPAAPVRQKQPRPPVPLTPRDIQARIRAGATAEQVAAESGVELASVRRYEGPVRAERDYVAYLAQRVEVATPIPSHDGYRSAFGDEPALLGDMVAYRVQGYGVDAASLEWDSWRRPDGSWHVEVSFELPDSSTVDLGEQPPAQWTYNPTRKTVVNGNRWAQVLSELEPLDGPLPARRLSAVADRVSDVEAEQQEHAPSGTGTDTDGLLDVLRSRRGQRLGVDEEGDDALAVLLTRGSVPAARPNDEVDEADGPAAEHTGGTGGPAARRLSLAPGADRVTGGDHDDDHHDDSGGDSSDAAGEFPGGAPGRQDDGASRPRDGVGSGTREVSAFAGPTHRPARAQRPTGDQRHAGPERAEPGSAKASGKDDTAARTPGSGGNRDAGDAPAEDAEAVGPERRIKPKRSSVPSWDDIVFGRKGE
ncbi:hypothetical protein AC792_00240 [Arthrobacter sp. RIT-PI-e]|uniref:septation protein SepH n=1 Tax=Arthrobacter sp. RIT-PI-e TaxID=1681197 RepID=UPI000676990E|nr:hypothetical protein AC792_00240 [Arthrobacter sp. RIT-PI-e]